MPPENGAREAGRVSATLDSLAERLERIESKLDMMGDWKSGVEARFATGSEKFRQLESRDRQAGWIASSVGIVAAGVAAVFAEIRK